MLRLACCLATERGIAVSAPVHDAILVEGPADAIEDVVAETRRAMVEASEIVPDGFAPKSLFQKPYAVVRLRGRLYRNRSRYFAPVSRRSIN